MRNTELEGAEAWWASRGNRVTGRMQERRGQGRERSKKGKEGGGRGGRGVRVEEVRGRRGIRVEGAREGVE